MSDIENSWFNNWPDGLLGLNKHNLIVEVSPMAQSILGFSRQELYGKEPHDTLCASARGDLHAHENCALISHYPNSETKSTLWTHKNGHYVSIDYRIIPVGFNESTRVISFIDNSTRLHNQAEMEKFSEYVEKSPAPLAEFVMDGQLLFGNSALQELILEYGFDDCGDSIAIPGNISAIAEKLTQFKNLDETAEVHLENRVFLWHFHLLENDNEPSMVGYAFDITEQKEAERIATEQNTLARKEFYAKMVHELRSPLNAIVGFSDLLIYDLKNKISEKSLQQLTMIKEAGIRLNDQVTATLDITKIESGKMSLDISNFAIKELCKEVSNEMMPLALEKNLSFDFASLTEQSVFSDKTKVRQIIVNLLSNAIKYTHEGQIHLVASEKDDKDLGESISILVSDTGMGVKKEDIPRLFLSFEQVNDEQTREIQGTGLGLSLVSNLVKLLGGRISVESTYGSGSTFELLLPFSSRHTVNK